MLKTPSNLLAGNERTGGREGEEREGNRQAGKDGEREKGIERARMKSRKKRREHMHGQRGLDRWMRGGGGVIGGKMKEKETNNSTTSHHCNKAAIHNT